MKQNLYAIASACLFAFAADAQQTNAPRLPEVEVRATAGTTAPGASVSSLDRRQIESAGVTALYDLPAQAPGLSLSRSVSRAFGDVYSIRGVANTEFFSSPAVALYVDGAPAGDAMTYPIDLVDLESVNLWRGPQGTYFGKNGPAGVLELRTRQPTDTVTARASATYASRETEQYRASVMGPLVPGKLRYALSGAYGHSDGFIENPLSKVNNDRSEDSSGRLALGWTPQEDLEIGFAATAENYNDGVRLAPLGADPTKVSSDVNQTADATGNGQVLSIRRTLPKAIVSSITTRREFSLDPLLLDLDLSQYPGNTALIKQDEELWSEELRVESPKDADDWTWRAGLFYANATRNGDDTRSFLAPTGTGQYMPVSQQTVFELTEDTYAGYGQATYAGIDRLGITVGARLDYTEKAIERTKLAMPGYPVPAIDDEDSYFTAAPKLGLDYRVNESIVAFASSGLGFKPGGFSAYIDPPKSPAFDTERNWASELGLKTTWLEGALLANAALFYNDIKDYQVERALLGSTDLTIVNAPEVTSQGVEAEVVVKPVQGLELSAAASVIDAQFDEFTSPDTGADLEGKTPPYIPEYTATLAALYRVTCGAFARVEYQAIGNVSFDAENSDTLTEGSYGLVNARLGYETKDYAITVFGANLTDEDYYMRRLMVAVPAGVPGDPQTFGITAAVKY